MGAAISINGVVWASFRLPAEEEDRVRQLYDSMRWLICRCLVDSIMQMDAPNDGNDILSSPLRLCSSEHANAYLEEGFQRPQLIGRTTDWWRSLNDSP